MEVPDIPPPGSTRGRSAESLSSWSVSSPSGVVPPSSPEDVMPPTHVSVPNVVSVDLAGVSGSPSPSLGVSAPVIGRSDQLRDRCDIGFTQHVVCNLTFPEYLISTLPHPRQTYRHTQTEKTKEKP